MRFVKKYQHVMAKINKALFWAMSALLIFMSLMLFYDVVARKIFGHQTSFGYDLNLWLTIVMAFIGGGYALHTKEHILVDVLYAHFGKRMKAVVNIVSGVLMLFLSYVLIKFGLQQTIVYFERGSVAMSGFNIHLWIKWAIVPVGGVLLAVQAILYELENIYLVVTGKEAEEKNETEEEAEG